MITLIKKKADSEEAIMIAESVEDWKTIDYIYHKGIMFGTYMLYNFKDDKNRSTDIAKFIQTKFPLAVGCMKVNIVEDFTNKEEPAEGVQHGIVG